MSTYVRSSISAKQQQNRNMLWFFCVRFETCMDASKSWNWTETSMGARSSETEQ